MLPWLASQPPLGVPFTLNRASPQARGLLAWWPTIGVNGSGVSDRAAGLHNGVWTGTPTYVPHPTTGRMFDFDGSSYVVVSANARLANLYPTLSAWVEFDSVSGYNTIIDKDVEWIIRGDNTNLTYHQWPDAQSITVTVTTGVLYHVAGTYDGVTMRLYLNGVQVNSAAKTGISGDFGNNVGIGAQGDGDVPMNGRVGDVRIYDRALSAAEVWQLYAPQTRWQLYAPLPLGVKAVATAGQPMMARGRLVPGMRPRRTGW